MGRRIGTLLGMLGCAAVWGTGAAAQDLDAGKSPAQLFGKRCAACHRGPGGLGAGKDPRALAGFLAQHYTSSRATAATLSGYLAGVGGDPGAARARTRTEPPPEPQAPAPQRPATAQGPDRGPQAPDPEGAAPVPARTADPQEARAAARERQKRRERREALENARALAREAKPVQPPRLGLPSVSSDPPPPIVSVAPVPVPQRSGAAAAATDGSAAQSTAERPPEAGNAPGAVADTARSAEAPAPARAVHEGPREQLANPEPTRAPLPPNAETGPPPPSFQGGEGRPSPPDAPVRGTGKADPAAPSSGSF